ncbi:hypothetical protein DFH07DRAFT_834318 [Mycena maculata]|uniref:BRCT domain-containing protein n=1 Tax=Mycena maculata TaxID=230809 RepID=A0AAD7IJV7_9AGAR|nr:hypothetical protein DFH07DRAFT_834318 [Mycena maculata]
MDVGAFVGATAVFSPNISPDLKRMFLDAGGKPAKYAEAATWFIAASLDDGEFIKNWYRADLRVVASDFVFEMCRCGGRVYSPNYGIAVSMDGDIVPASEVFDYDHPDFRPAMAIFKVFPPPSPFAPGPHFEQAETHGGTKGKRDAPIEAQTAFVEVIDLTMDDDDEYEERQATNQITEMLLPKVEEREISLKISPRKKVKRR